MSFSNRVFPGRLVPGLFAALAMLFAAQAARAQLASTLVPDNSARQAQLERMWSTSLRVDPTRGRVQSIRFHANLVIAQTSLGVIQALDAETGRTYWTMEVGSANLETTPPAVNDKFVTATNGSNLIVLARATGAIMFQQRLGGAPSAGPGASFEYAIVPLANGVVEAYKMDRQRLMDSFPLRFSGTGAATTAPIIVGDRAMWATPQGYVYSRELVKSMVQFRFQLDDDADAAPAYLSPYVFAASRSGRVYALHEERGTEVWQFSTEHSISHPIVTLEGRLFVITEKDTMFRLDPRVGSQIWFAPSVAKFLAASATRLYVLDPQGRVNVLDSETGSRLAVLAGTGGYDVPTINMATDRIYLCDSNGLLQCLREMRPDPKPIYHARGYAIPPPKKPGEATPPAEGAIPADGTAPAVPAAGGVVNPFGS